MIINLQNQLTQQQTNEITYLASAVSAGGTLAPAKNIGGFNASWAVQIGQTGEETAEIMLLGASAPSGTSFTMGTSPSHSAGTFLFGHAIDTPIYQIHYDQFILNRSITGTVGGGSFAAIATVSITPDGQYTQYNDTTGSAGYAYYAQYYNSVTGDKSGSSSIFFPGGPTFYSLQAIRQRAKEKLYSANYIREDSIINNWINECYELMVNSAIKVNQGYMIGTNQYGFGTNGYATITDPSFKQAVKIEVTYDASTYIPSTEVAVHNFTESDFFNAFSPRHSWIGENVFEVLPHQTAGSAKVTYAQRFTPMVNDSDELTQTLKAYTTAFVEYVLSVAYGLDQKDVQQQEHFQKFVAYQNEFVAGITPRDVTGPKTIDLAESISGMGDDISSDVGDYVW